MDCQGEARNLFEKLISWKEHSNKEISNIINTHSSNISKGIQGLAEEVSGLQEEVSVLKKERTVLLDTVDNLNGEVRELRAKMQSWSKPEEETKQSRSDEAHPCFDVEISEISKGNGVNEIRKKIESGDSDKNSTIAERKINLNKHNCQECGFIFSTTDNLRIHMKNIHSISEGIDNFEIDIGSMNESDYRSIESVDHREKMLQGKKFSYETSIEQSLTRKSKVVHANEGDKMHDNRKSSSQKHQNVKTLYTDDKKFGCRKCPYKSEYKHNLTKHIKGMHDKVRNHVCGYCGYKTSQKANLQRHLENVHNTQEKKFICDKCTNKTFRDEFELNEHIRGKHDKVKDQVCNYCGYATSWRSALRKHNKMVHQVEGTKFKCKLCRYESDWEASLQKHVKSIHM